MSGPLELAGFALAVFPLIVSFLEHYEEGFKTIKAWRYYRLEFNTIVSELNREKILFKQHIEGLVRSISDSEYDVAGMMSDLNRPEWKSADLTLRLKAKMSGDNEFEIYRLAIETIHESLEKLKQRIEKCRPTSNDVGEQKGLSLGNKFHRVQFAFKKKAWQKQLKELGAQIDRADKLLGNADSLGPGRESNNTAISQAIKEVKIQAASLHNAIVNSWSCECRDKHCVKLLLPKTASTSASQREPVARDLYVTFPSRQGHGIWAQSETALLEDDVWCTANATYKAPPPPPSSAGREEWQRAESISSASIAPSVPWTLTSQTTTLTPLTTPSLYAQPKSQRSSYQTDTISLIKQPVLEDTSNPFLISDLCHRLLTRGEDPVLGCLADQDGAYHILQISPILPFDTADCDRVIRLGALLNREVMRSPSSKDPDSPEPLKLSRSARMAIALKLARSLLELYPTPWLRNDWGKMDVYFFQLRTGEIMTDFPFLLWEMVLDRGETPKTSAAADDPHQALLSLGILIMELWFGETIESRPYWRKHFGPDGLESENTRLTAAFRWQKDVAEEGGTIIHDTTYRCIHGSFGTTMMNFEDPRFVGSVYDGVIRPLEQLQNFMFLPKYVY